MLHALAGRRAERERKIVAQRERKQLGVERARLRGKVDVRNVEGDVNQLLGAGLNQRREGGGRGCFARVEGRVEGAVGRALREECND